MSNKISAIQRLNRRHKQGKKAKGRFQIVSSDSSKFRVEFGANKVFARKFNY
jgi:hypothetical protein